MPRVSKPKSTDKRSCASKDHQVAPALKKPPLKLRPEGPGLTVRCSESSVWFSAQETDAAECCAQYLSNCDESRLEVVLVHLQKWPDEFRFAAMQAIADAKAQVTVEDASGKRSASNLFDVVLGSIKRYETVNEQAAIRQAACEVVAMLPPSHHDDAIDRIREQYTLKRLPVPTKASLKSAVKNLTSSGDSTLSQNVAGDVARMYLDSLRLADLDPGDDDVPLLMRHQFAWFRFTGAIWRKVSGEEVESEIVKMLHANPIDGLSITQPLIRDVLLNLRGICGGINHGYEGSLWLDMGAEPIPSPYIACQNGLLDMQPVLAGVRRPELCQFSPRHFSTVQLGFSYDPAAKCPLWDQTIKQILPRKKKGDRRRERLQEFLGWTLVECGPNMEAVAILVGSGANGKSTVLNQVEAVLGRDNVSHISLEDLGHNFRLAQLKGKHANVVNDMNHVDKFKEGVLKQITSRDAIQYEEKYKDAATMYPFAKMIFGTNILPSINDRSEATHRRLLIIPFLESFLNAAADKNLGQKLLAELSGIANWMLAGLVRLIEREQFSDCAICTPLQQQYRIDCDPMLQFFELCEFESTGVEPQEMLFICYKRFCKDNNRHPVNSSEFVRRLEEKGCKSSRPDAPSPRPRLITGITFLGDRPYGW
jgi:P4 family phage/plasmid primase-like protien